MIKIEDLQSLESLRQSYINEDLISYNIPDCLLKSFLYSSTADRRFVFNAISDITINEHIYTSAKILINILRTCYAIQCFLINRNHKLNSELGVDTFNFNFINSGYRNSEVNALVGGKPYSFHQVGMCVDIDLNRLISSSYESYQLFDFHADMLNSFVPCDAFAGMKFGYCYSLNSNPRPVVHLTIEDFKF